MLTIDQAQGLSGARNVVALSRHFSNEDLALRYAQVAVPFVSEHAAYLTIHFAPEATVALTRVQTLARALHEEAEASEYKWVALLGVDCDLWKKWHPQQGAEWDDGLFQESGVVRGILKDNQPPYALAGGDLFFQIQSRDADTARTVAERICDDLEDVLDVTRTNYTVGDSMHGGRIYGGRMLHGLIGAVDPVSFSARALIGNESMAHRGACFCLSQRFVHNWQFLLGMADNEMENLIGRDHVGNIITNDDDRAHVKLARVLDEDGLHYLLVGQSQPFRGANCYTFTRNLDSAPGKKRLTAQGKELSVLNRSPGIEGARNLPDQSNGEIGNRRLAPVGKEDGIYQLSYAKTLGAFSAVLRSMLGEVPKYIKCRHLNFSKADLGNVWYVPSAMELGLPAPHKTLTVVMNGFFDRYSANGRMFYNAQDYLHRVGNRKVVFDPPLTDRVIELVSYNFSRWHDTWYRRRPAPELGPLKKYLQGEERAIFAAPLPERKGFAIRKTLELLSQPKNGRAFDTFRIHPRELIVGVVPDFTLGSGFEAMACLDEDRGEISRAFLLKLNDAGAAGHNVPDYRRLLNLGVGGLISAAQQGFDLAKEAESRSFYQSVIYALEGVRIYLRNYAALAREKLLSLSPDAFAERSNLQSIAERLEKLAVAPPSTFIEAAQLIFSMHCCMHIAAESVSIGRLDQLLFPFYERDGLSPEQAQEIIDCFWIKMDEKVLLNHRHVNDRLSRGSCGITYQGGDFPQGAALNQWVQQVTVGGYLANDANEPEDGCNAVTLLCLRAARRLPMNAPCLTLRVNPSTPQVVLEEAAQAILSGGGHPFLINDDKLIAGLLHSAKRPAEEGGNIMPLHDARDVVCDGCYEALVPGKCEFAFSFVPVPEAIEMALNRGRTYGMAGPVHLAGLKASFRSAPPDCIDSWERFYQLFLEHYRFKLIEFYDGMLGRYGNLSQVCPSPLLSPLIDGCLESGRDLSAGGARYKLLAPLMNAMTTAIDSLWAIQSMVFSGEAVFTLAEFADCLINDWGWDMKEPFYSQTIGPDRIAVQAERYKKLRLYALSLPKFGQGHQALDTFARQVVRDLVRLAHEVIRAPSGLIAERMASLRKRFGTKECPFEFIICPGIATFEDYAGIGSFLGASADGRRSGQPVASDLSPSTAPLDMPASDRGPEAITALASWLGDPNHDDDPAKHDPIGVGLSNGSPVNITIRESFPLRQLVELLKGFADGKLGPNMMCISCADLSTLEAAQKSPEVYDLVRLRMGGWSEFFVAMFPEHQEHHKRRPFFEASPELTTAAVSTLKGAALEGRVVV